MRGYATRAMRDARAGPIRGCQTGTCRVFSKIFRKNFPENLVKPSKNALDRARKSVSLAARVCRVDTRRLTVSALRNVKLSPVQLLAIKYLAAGWSEARISQELKIGKTMIKKWRAYDHEFQKELESASANHAELLGALLIKGEREAAETLMEALKAESVSGRPNWNARISAALSLLDRAGQRGKAIERQQVAAVVARAEPDVSDALRRALRDPGVRSWLKEAGSVPALTSGVSASEDVELEVDLAPSDPDVAPINLNSEVA